MEIHLEQLTIRTAHDAMRAGRFSAVELTRAYLAEIEKKNRGLNAYLEVFADAAAQAAAADARFKDGTAGMLTGIPIAVKDNILIKGRRVGAASKILEGYVASYDATAIAKLKAAGAVFLGRTNMDEFAMGGSTENSAYGVTRNPHDGSRVAGGSSGGSAAAVAAGLALAALGSDTGGSVRQPASFCGVVGMKPTYGAVSRHGLIAMGSSLDQIGPLAKTAEDAEILFDAIKGPDPLDSTTISLAPRSRPAGSSAGKKGGLPPIGVPRSFTEADGVAKEVIASFNESLGRLKELGYPIKEVSLPHAPYALSVYYIIMPAEASTNLARFDGVKYGLRAAGGTLLDDYRKTRGEGFGREVRRRILLGTYVLSSGYYDAYYHKANQVRELIAGDFEKVFKEVAIIAMPTAPGPAFPIGEKAKDPLAMYLADIFTVTANITGMPALSVPAGTVAEGSARLPVGIQFIAPRGADAELFAIGRSFAPARS